MKIVVVALIYFGLINADLCNIRIYITDDPNEQVDFNQKQQVIESLQTDKYYHIYCLTNEKVRTRNFISLFQTNKTQDMDSKLNKKFQISSWSYTEKNVTYMKASLIINSKNYTNDFQYTVLCRFLPVNPSIYCEKSVNLKIINLEFKNFTTFTTVLIVCAILCLINVLLKVKFSKKADKYIQKTSGLMSSVNNNSNLNTDLEANSKDQDLVEIPIAKETKFLSSNTTSIIQS